MKDTGMLLSQLAILSTQLEMESKSPNPRYGVMDDIRKAMAEANKKLMFLEAALDAIDNPPPKQEPINPFQSVPLQDRKLIVSALEDAHDRTVAYMGEEQELANRPHVVAAMQEVMDDCLRLINTIRSTYTGNPAQAKEELEDENLT